MDLADLRECGSAKFLVDSDPEAEETPRARFLLELDAARRGRDDFEAGSHHGRALGSPPPLPFRSGPPCGALPDNRALERGRSRTEVKREREPAVAGSKVARLRVDSPGVARGAQTPLILFGICLCAEHDEDLRELDCSPDCPTRRPILLS